jgi:NAD(P)-dependent dehydrogenase (short-subunit alcohol dehydrogenase family)
VLFASVVRLFDAVVADHGKGDVLVNNAGVAVFEMVTELTEDAFHKQCDLNVLGYSLAVREAPKHFGETGGSIINISSILSTHPPRAAGLFGDQGRGSQHDLRPRARAWTPQHPGERDYAGLYLCARHGRWIAGSG